MKSSHGKQMLELLIPCTVVPPIPIYFRLAYLCATRDKGNLIFQTQLHRDLPCRERLAAVVSFNAHRCAFDVLFLVKRGSGKSVEIKCNNLLIGYLVIAFLSTVGHKAKYRHK